MKPLFTDSQRSEIKKLSEPLMKFLFENTDPHTRVEIQSDKVTILEEDSSQVDMQFIQD